MAIASTTRARWPRPGCSRSTICSFSRRSSRTRCATSWARSRSRTSGWSTTPHDGVGARRVAWLAAAAFGSRVRSPAVQRRRRRAEHEIRLWTRRLLHSASRPSRRRRARSSRSSYKVVVRDKKTRQPIESGAGPHLRDERGSEEHRQRLREGRRAGHVLHEALLRRRRPVGDRAAVPPRLHAAAPANERLDAGRAGATELGPTRNGPGQYMRHFFRTQLAPADVHRGRRRILPRARAARRHGGRAARRGRCRRRTSGTLRLTAQARGRALHVRRGRDRSDGREPARSEREAVLRRAAPAADPRTRSRRRTDGDEHGTGEAGERRGARRRCATAPTATVPRARPRSLTRESEARALLLDAAHALARGAARRAVPPDEGRRRAVSLARPGGRRGRQRLRARAPRHPVAADPQPRLDAREGRDAGGDPPAVHGEGRFADARPRAQHPLRRPRSRLHRPDLAARRHGAGDGRRHAVVQDARARIASGSSTSATARRPPARFTRASTSPPCSAVRSSSIVENNGYAYSTPIGEADRGEAVHRQGDRLRHPGRAGRRQRRARRLRRDASAPSTARARGGGVTLVELITYRRKGHAEHDNQSYVPAGEIERWARENDPIDRYLAVLRDELGVERRGARRRSTRACVARSTPRPTRPSSRRCPSRSMRSSASTPTRRPSARSGSAKGPARAVRRARARRRLGHLAATAHGSTLMAEITYLEAIREALFEEMERDENVFCLGEDIGAYGGAFKVTEGLLGRVRRAARHRHADLGDRRSSARRRARRTWGCVRSSRCSSSTSSRTPTTCSPTTWRRRAIARFSRARWSCAGPSGGYVRGGPFHSQNPEAAFVHTPGLKIVYPATAEDAKGLHEGGDPRRRLRALLRAQVPLPPHQGGDAGGRPRRPDRQGARRRAKGRTSRSSPTPRRSGRRSRRPSSWRRKTASRSR